MQSSCGVVYVAWGDFFVAEAIGSARLLSLQTPYRSVLITSKSLTVEHPFEDVIVASLEGSYKDKILMRLSPFERTIFLDSDTIVLGDISGLFRLLERFDVFFQPQQGGNHYELDGVPIDAFPEPSAGLVGWRRNNATEEMFHLWEQAYLAQELKEGHGAWDQRSLRQALWQSQVSLTMVSHDWQLISFNVGVCLGQVKIVHGRGAQAESVAAQINSTSGLRVYLPRLGIYAAPLTVPDLILLSIRCAYRALTRAGRLLFHYTGLYPLPKSRRRM